MKRRGHLQAWVYGGSVVFHAALALGAYLLPKEHKVESVAIELADIKKKNEKPKAPAPPPPPPPPPTEKPKPPPPPPKEKAKVAAELPKEAPLPETLDENGFADLSGISLGNASAAGAGGDVAAVAPAKASGLGAGHAAAATRKVQALAPAAMEQCTEPDVRPKHMTQTIPKMTRAAQSAEIEGVVRVEVTVDESGKVISARVLNGLGYGLDEEALRAAKTWTFHPATRCGKPMIGHTIIPFRFSLT